MLGGSRLVSLCGGLLWGTVVLCGKAQGAGAGISRNGVGEEMAKAAELELEKEKRLVGVGRCCRLAVSREELWVSPLKSEGGCWGLSLFQRNVYGSTGGVARGGEGIHLGGSLTPQGHSKQALRLRFAPQPGMALTGEAPSKT